MPTLRQLLKIRSYTYSFLQFSKATGQMYIICIRRIVKTFKKIIFIFQVNIFMYLNYSILCNLVEATY